MGAEEIGHKVTVTITGKEEFKKLSEEVEKKYGELETAIEKLNSFTFTISTEEGE